MRGCGNSGIGSSPAHIGGRGGKKRARSDAAQQMMQDAMDYEDEDTIEQAAAHERRAREAVARSQSRIV